MGFRLRIHTGLVSLLVLVAMGTLGACGEDVLSGVGESCTKTADCERGLVCLASTCVHDGTPRSPSTEGESCTKTSDCESGLHCVGLVCVLSGMPRSLSAEGESCTKTSDCESGLDCVGWVCVGPNLWTDSKTGLIWQVNAAGAMNWSQAKGYCADLVLCGFLDWHLPSIGELRTLIRGCPATVHGGSCNVEEGDCLASSCKDDSCDGCSSGQGPADSGCYWPTAMQGTCSSYWSSSLVEDLGDRAWRVVFNDGYVGHDGDVSYDGPVRCVRDAP